MKTVKRLVAIGGLGAALAMLPSAARADGPPAAGAAEDHFREAQELMVSGDFEAALRLLVESQALKPGLGVLLNIAYCQEKLGKSATAWAGYLNAAAIAHARGDAKREEFARAQATTLALTLARLKVDVSNDSGREDLDVRVDGASLPKSSWGHPVPIDPGWHELQAHAKEARDWSASVAVEPHGSAVVRVPVLEDAPEGSASTKEEPPAARADVAAAPRSHGQWMRPTAVVIGALGVASAAAGAYFGLHAPSVYNRSYGHCGQTTVPDPCDDPGYQARSDAHTLATESTVAFAVAAAALGGGIALWLLAPPSSSSTPAAGMVVRPAISTNEWSLTLGRSW